MPRLLWNLSVHVRNLLHRFAPTNVLSDAIRTRRGLKWGTPAMLLSVPYLYVAYLCTVIIDGGGPGWLYLLVLLFIWNAMKMNWIGPISLILLVRVRTAEAKQRRTVQRMNDESQSHGTMQTVPGGRRGLIGAGGRRRLNRSLVWLSFAGKAPYNEAVDGVWFPLDAEVINTTWE